MRLLLVSAALLALASCGKPDMGKTKLPQGFKLTDTSVTLPDDSAETYPAGPGAEAMNNTCRACHSPSMVLLQPPLRHEEWVKEVDKMRGTFKAPVADNDMPAILAYLDALSARQPRGKPSAVR